MVQGKGKRFAALNIRKISGGRDPLNVVQEFITGRGFDPDACLQQKTADNVRWMVPLGNELELEIVIEGLKVSQETSIYMGVNVVTVPLRNSQEVLVTALQVADGLVGIKLSLVGYYLVLSASIGASAVGPEDVDFYYSLIIAQLGWFKDSLLEELGWDEFPQE